MSLDPIVKHINTELIREFGFVYDKPKFRIIWTGDQFEKRLAEYNDFDGNKIRIRTVTEVREVPKYPYVNPPWWMLERRMKSSADESIKNWNGYEPLYLFRHFDGSDYGDYLPPRLDMALVACKMSLVRKEKRNYEMDKGEFEDKEDRKEKDIFEQVKDMTSDLAHHFHHKEAVIMDGSSSELPVSPNLVEK